MVTVPGCSPVRFVEVVATVVHCPVPSAHLTLLSACQERFGAVRRDHALRGVNHRQTLQQRNLMQTSIDDLNYNICISTLAIASLDNEYCLARALEVSWRTVPRCPTFRRYH